MLNKEAFALYDVVNAKTVSNEVLEKYEEDEVDDVSSMDMDLPNYDSQRDLGEVLSKKFKKIFNIKQSNLEQEEIIEEPIVKNETAQEDNEFTPYVEQEVIDNYKFQINADKVTYDDTNGNIKADGNVEIIAKLQEVKLKADHAFLDKISQTLKLAGNVKIIKKGVEMTGEYLLVDLNEQNILMDNPTLNAYSFIINAQEGYLIANDIQMLNGSIKSASNTEFPLMTRGFMRYDNIARDFAFEKKARNDLDVDSKRQTYKIDSKEVVVTSYKDHNSILLKGSNVFYNNKKLVRNADIEIISDKKKQVVETSAPEAGNLRNFGTYIGYGMVFKMPKGHTFKLMPVAAYKDSDVGVGAIGRYRSPNHMVEAGWNTASENWVVRGKYRIADNLAFSYGRNAYLPEGFLGARRSGYAGQFQYTNSYRIKDLNAIFNNGVYVGLFSDYDKEDQEDAYSTTRFRYMADLRKNLTKYKSRDKDFTIQLDAQVQGAATVYGSGETTGIFRVGPSVTSRFKKWEQSIAYMLSGTHGHSPFLFDEYYYGKSTIMLNEKINFNDKFALGIRLFVTPMKDNYNEELFTEQRVYFIVGPKDTKVAFSYDFVRDVAHLDFMFLLGSDNATINFDKLTTKDIDGKQERRDFYKNAKRVVIEKPENI